MIISVCREKYSFPVSLTRDLNVSFFLKFISFYLFILSLEKQNFTIIKLYFCYCYLFEQCEIHFNIC